MKMPWFAKAVCCCCVLLLAHSGSRAQNFSVFDSLPAGAYGAAAWGDYDGDGRQDLAYTAQSLQPGTPDFMRVYHTTASGLVPLPQHFPFLSLPAVHWADFDNDGKADLLCTGMDSAFKAQTLLYRSNGDGSFTQVEHTGLPACASAAIDVTDYNGDGWQDLLLTGYDSTSHITAALLKGGADFTFTCVQTSVDGIYNGEAKWGDFNNDGRPDLLMNGEGAGGLRAALYQNMGADSFRLLPQVFNGGIGTADWIDYDGDGFPDMLLAGVDTSGVQSFTDLYHNNGGSGTFTKQRTNLPAFGEPVGIAVADFNRDGKPDICFTGGTDFSRQYSALAFGTGTANFKLDTFFNGDILNPIAEAADIDSDGYPDLIFGNLILKNQGKPTEIYGLSKYNMDLQVFPNPSLVNPEIIWTAGRGTTTRVTLYSLGGKRLFTYELLAAAGPNTYTLELKNIPAGTYLVAVQSAEGYDFRRLTKL